MDEVYKIVDLSEEVTIGSIDLNPTTPTILDHQGREALLSNFHRYEFEEFISRTSSIRFQDTDLQEVLNSLPSITDKGPYLAGGALRRLVLGESKIESDVDIFFRDQIQVDEFKKVLDSDEKFKYIKSNEFNHLYEFKGIKIQLIFYKFYSDMYQLLNSFDFTLCQFGYDGTYLTVGEYSIHDTLKRRLAVNRITLPVSSLRRLIKYTKQGFNACNGCLRQLLTESSEVMRSEPDGFDSQPVYVD